MNNEKIRQERERIVKLRLNYRRLRQLTNRSLRCALECPHKKRTLATCMGCKNPECVAAKAALDAYWVEVDAK